MPVAAPAQRTVSAFEDRLLRILYAVMRLAPLEPVMPLVLERVSRPKGLSRSCVELVSDTLVKGCTLFLVREGGWRRERFLRDGEPREGRLWERWQPAELGLHFTKHSLEFLIWLTVQRPGDHKPPWEEHQAELTPADRLLLLLTFDLLRDTEVSPALRSSRVLIQDGLIRLAYPEDFIDTDAEIDFSPWLGGRGIAVLEALQPWLYDRWRGVEQRKKEIGDWSRMRDFGLAQERILESFTNAVEAANRPDLVRFLLQTCAAIMPVGVTASAFVGALQGVGPARLAERVDVHRRALALPRHLERLHHWVRRARSVGYLDDGYAASQLWKVDWERFEGDALALRAAALLREIEPMAVTA